MATKNLDARTDRSDRASDDAGSDDPDGRRRDAEAARRSFEADERAAAARSDDRERPDGGRSDWNAVGLVTSLGATCLFGLGGTLGRSAQLTTVAFLTLAATGLLVVRRGGRRLR